MKPWLLVAAIVAALGLALAVTMLLRDDDQPTSADRAADPQATTASSAPSDATAPRTSGRRIQTTSSFYFGRPFETILIEGRYRGVNGGTELRVQRRQGHRWTQFPLPVVTQPSGKFRAYVELGQGQYQLRIVDPDRGRASRVLTLLLF
jgi:hypothetical protein